MNLSKNRIVKKLLDFVSTNKFIHRLKPVFLTCLRLYMKVQIELVWFFSSTTIGYTIFILIALLTHLTASEFKTLPEYYKIMSAVGFIFVYGLLGLSAELFLICKTNFTRRLLYELVGEEYVLKKLGNPGARPFIKLGFAVGGVLTAEIASIYVQDQSNYGAVDKYMEAAQKSGQTPDLGVVDRYLSRPPLAGKTIVSVIESLKGDK